MFECLEKPYHHGMPLGAPVGSGGAMDPEEVEGA